MDPTLSSANSSSGRRLLSSGKRRLRWVSAWRFPQMKQWRNIGSKTSHRANVETDRATIAAVPEGQKLLWLIDGTILTELDRRCLGKGRHLSRRQSPVEIIANCKRGISWH